MRAYTSLQRRLTVHLEGDEQFEWEVRTGRIMVQTVSFHEGLRERNAVTFRGPAIKKKTGETGFINREGDVSLRDVPSQVILCALAALQDNQLED